MVGLQWCGARPLEVVVTRAPEKVSPSEPRVAEVWPAVVQSETCGCSPCCLLQCTRAGAAPSHRHHLQVFSGVALPLPAARTSPPLPPGKGEGQGESLTHSVFKATIVSTRDFLVGQALGTSRKALWTSPERLDMLP